MMMTAIYYVKRVYKMSMRLKTSVEPIWFEIMIVPPFILFSGVLLKFLECSREI